VSQKEPLRLTKFELEVMHMLWEMGEGSVRDILDRFHQKETAYTTIQTIVRRLEDKGAVCRVKKVGKALVFKPTVTRKATRNSLLREVLDMFGGSARPLMAHLAETGDLSLDDLRELERIMEEQAVLK
jgi:BlaI family penicillinase repressor